MKHSKIKFVIKAVFIFMMFVGVTSAQSEQLQKQRNAEKLLQPEKTLEFMKTEEYKKAHQRLVKYFGWLYEPKEQNEILDQSKEDILKILKDDKNFWKVAKARYWCAKNIDKIYPDLIGLLKDSKEVGLEGQADLIIWERIESKDLKFYGHGWVVGDDLFQVAGRSSWMLSETTGQNLGSVSMKSTNKELKEYSKIWEEWFKENK